MGKFWSGSGFWLYQSAFGSWIRVQWHQLWVRQDEFHRSLEMDSCALNHMNELQQQAYLGDLHLRRRIASRHAAIKKLAQGE